MQNTHFLGDYKALRIIFILIFTLFSLNSYSHSGASHEDEEVNIYSGRKGKLIEPMLKKFESDTGIKVNVIFFPVCRPIPVAFIVFFIVL